ncbi:hypothetical protein NG796_17845 [Laspinema sp. A4]|nr:hypothetical protein [Laspinema sp. D2d]MCT7985139.1 hypothetical protein [Laspinema sp. D2d]
MKIRAIECDRLRTLNTLNGLLTVHVRCDCATTGSNRPAERSLLIQAT